MQEKQQQNIQQQQTINVIPQADKKIYIFGDSFVKIFEVVKNSNIKFKKYKGATMKGVTRPKNKNHIEIESLIKEKQNEIGYIVFNFGQVDYNFSCYYKLVRQQQYDQQEIISEYFKWINSLPVQRKIVIVTYPSPLQKDTICGALIKYLILTKDQVLQNRERILMEFENHKERFQKWRRLFKKYSNQYKTIKIVDLSNRILDTKNRVKRDYRDINNYNIHILWKKLIFDLKEKFEKFFVIQIDEQELKKGEEDYQKNKKKRMRQEFIEYDFLNIGV